MTTACLIVKLQPEQFNKSIKRNNLEKHIATFHKILLLLIYIEYGVASSIIVAKKYLLKKGSTYNLNMYIPFPDVICFVPNHFL